MTVLWLLPSSYCFSCSNSHCFSGWVVHQESVSWFLIHVGRMNTRLSWDVGGTMRSEAITCHRWTGSCSAGHFLEVIVVQNWVLPIVGSWHLCASSGIVGASIPNKPVYLWLGKGWEGSGSRWLCPLILGAAVQPQTLGCQKRCFGGRGFECIFGTVVTVYLVMFSSGQWSVVVIVLMTFYMQVMEWKGGQWLVEAAMAR